MRSASTCNTLEGVDVECTHCGIRMSSHTGGGGTIRYFHCPGCQRWVSSVYTDVFRVDAKVRTRAVDEQKRSPFDNVRGRLEKWLAALDQSDPYRALGCSPVDSDDDVRAKYRELARVHHPDRGGKPEQMQKINDAYDRIRKHREQRAREALGAGRAVHV